MAHRALDIIRDEHRALAGILVALRSLVRDARDGRAPPDFGLWRAIVFYIHAFPERLHHPKETEGLFRQLRARSPEAAATLDRLDADHHHGEASVARLMMQVVECEQLGASRLASFAEAVERYVGAYLQHMETEEREILPLAEHMLQPQDWAALDEAFGRNRDPLTGHAPQAEFRGLFTRIVNLAPAPHGLGPSVR